MISPSIARNLFEQYTVSGAFSLLKSLPSTSPKTFETSWLEFKSGFVRDEDFERIWSEVIGAFANTGGGVVVWGIGAAYDSATKVDAAGSVQWVQDVNAFTTRLRRAAQSNIDPPVENLEIIPVPESESASRGFVVFFIPEGRVKPYESLKAEKQFYMRFDDRSEKVPLPVLRVLFQPSQDTRPALTVQWEEASSRQKGGLIRFAFSLTNRGFNSIRSACVSVQASGRELFHETNGRHEALAGHLTLQPPVLHPSMSANFEVFASQYPPERISFASVLYQDGCAARTARLTSISGAKSFTIPPIGSGFSSIRFRWFSRRETGVRCAKILDHELKESAP